MKSNRLQLNTAKTEVLWCASNRRHHQLPQSGLRIGADVIIPSVAVRNLGVCLDCDVTMKTHVSKVVSGCFAVLRQLRSIRPSVTRPSSWHYRTVDRQIAVRAQCSSSADQH